MHITFMFEFNECVAPRFTSCIFYHANLERVKHNVAHYLFDRPIYIELPPQFVFGCIIVLEKNYALIHTQSEITNLATKRVL